VDHIFDCFCVPLALPVFAIQKNRTGKASGTHAEPLKAFGQFSARQGSFGMTLLSRELLQTLKAQAMIAEKGEERFTVRLSVVGGQLLAGHIQAIAQLAAQFGDGSVHLTTRQGLEIPHVMYENLAPLQAALEAAGVSLAATGNCVRSIIACPGMTCTHGVIDSQGLAQRLHAQFKTRKDLPHKFKIAIAGCVNGCTKPQENDLGIQGNVKGFTVLVGGKMGKQPRWADVLPLDIPDEAALFRVVQAAIDWFAANGNPGERFGSAIDRLGLESLTHACQP
jgi:dissimilatory sulfite reductase (desulfoviridin) alpha/beta subunit